MNYARSTDGHNVNKSRHFSFFECSACRDDFRLLYKSVGELLSAYRHQSCSEYTLNCI